MWLRNLNLQDFFSIWVYLRARCGSLLRQKGEVNVKLTVSSDRIKQQSGVASRTNVVLHVALKADFGTKIIRINAAEGKKKAPAYLHGDCS